MIINKTSVEVSVQHLKPGMFVSDLDRPWLETPYLIQGILIQSQDDIDELARHCTYVYVDMEKSDSSVTSLLSSRNSPSTTQSASNDHQLQYKKELESLKIPSHRAETYIDTCTADEELPAATRAFDNATSLFSEINISLQRNTKLNIQAAHEVVDTLRESIVRNPDAALLLARLRSTGQELYDNAIKTSVLLLAFGRQLGLPRKELSILGMGGLLMDIGKLRLPAELQTKNSFTLTPDERKLIKQHVSYGEAIIEQSNNVSEQVCKIVAQHHERENGNGYPRGLYANTTACVCAHGSHRGLLRRTHCGAQRYAPCQTVPCPQGTEG